MRQTLYHIDNDLFGIPLIGPEGSNYGFGLLLALVAVLGVGFLLYRIRQTGFDAEARNNLIVLLIVCGGIVLVAPHLLAKAPDSGKLGLPIRGYGVMLLLAVVSAVLVAMRRAKQVGLHPDVILSLAMWIFVFGIIGARLLYIVRNLDDFQGRPFGEIVSGTLNVTKGGLVVYGGLLGGAVGFLIFSLKNKIKLLPFADIIAASLVLGQAIGRLGCLMNGCCYGGVCDLPVTAVTFPWESPPNIHQVHYHETDLFGMWFETESDGQGVKIREVIPDSAATVAGMQPGERILGIDGVLVDHYPELAQIMIEAVAAKEKELSLLVAGTSGETSPRILTIPSELPRSQPVYPTQIYGFINGTLFFFFAWVLFPFRRRDGEVFATLLLLFPITRFLMEVIRTDEPQSFFLGMTISQTISVLLSLSGVALWVYLSRQPKGNLAGPETWQPINARFVSE